LSGQPLRLELRASPALTVLTLAVHGLAMAILWSTLALLPGVCAVALLAVLAVIALRERTLLRAANAPSVLELKGDGSLSIRLRGGREIGGVPAPRRYVSRWLVVFDLVLPPRAHRTILVARDMLAPGEFRHLRLWALWSALPAACPDGKA
jgi:hypothetical protein